jgi:RNA-directed DNA polymerase
MKRHGGLFASFCSFKNLLLAYEKAKKGSNTPESKRFGFFLETELLALQLELQEGRYRPQAYRYFQIHDPKQRTISVAPFRDRVVHHALVNLLEPIFEPCFIHHSYATRKGKGVHKAVNYAQASLRKYKWFFKADIEQYFNSICHKTLLKLVECKVKDSNFLTVLKYVIANGGENNVGLPIGNLTSQFFANVYLNLLDHFVLRELLPTFGGGSYVRYMDDFVIFLPQRKQVVFAKKQIAVWLATHLKLQINPSSSFINQRMNGLRFLGARIFVSLKRIHSVNWRRIKRRLAFKNSQRMLGKLTTNEFEQTANSYWAHLKHFDSKKLRIWLSSQYSEI